MTKPPKIDWGEKGQPKNEFEWLSVIFFEEAKQTQSLQQIKRTTDLFQLLAFVAILLYFLNWLLG
jgi:hypothetical protein